VNRFEATARQITADLTVVRLGCALVGGFAVSVRAEPRFTRDLDLAVAVADDHAAEAAVRDLVGRGYRIVATVEHEASARLATVRLELPQDGEIADLLFASSGIEHEIVDAAEVIEVLPGLDLAVARTGHLIAIKLLARDDETRPQDAADLRALVSVADEAELALAHEAVTLIEQRGYNRGRSLGASWR
jgi:predicted nucleotidyltransferase